MAWGREAGTRLITEVLVGIATAIVALALFLPIPMEWKTLGIVVLVSEGALVLMAQLGVGRSLIWALKEWSRGRLNRSTSTRVRVSTGNTLYREMR